MLLVIEEFTSPVFFIEVSKEIAFNIASSTG